MIIQDRVAIITGRVIRFITRYLGIGGGSAAPGLYALRISPKMLERCVQSCHYKIVITGTNGKTTTTQLLVSWLRAQHHRVVTNKTGSNLARGIISAMIESSTLTGSLPSNDYGVFELDEAEYARSYVDIQPDIVVITNLFRDQLDRYGETDTTRKKWLSAMKNTVKPLIVIFNTADPQLCTLATELATNPQITTVGWYTQIENQQLATISNPILTPIVHAHCPQCNTLLTFNQQTIVGQGLFSCNSCGFSNPKARVVATAQDGVLTIQTQDHQYLHIQSNPDAIMATNITAAVTAGYLVKQNLANWQEILSTTKQTFGRFEEVNIQETRLIITLVKNPTGFTETLKSINKQSTYTTAAFILNDNYADGTDVSWIWDVPIQDHLPPNLNQVYTAGTRVHDISLRLHYADLPSNTITAYQTIDQLCDSLLTHSGTVPIFATYTAMLELQEWLRKYKVKEPYWK